ncbi:MAG: 1-acyl-sn-glycerol-3-phosphate acyltransferase [Bacteroidales bacterium]|jgi:1-acyl-sn-glycerol-3-phosphate acyltransferase|nr:1-acyl-sn-glycerol-3-phosphate acyltransferase [Bacteroidales bacterium]
MHKETDIQAPLIDVEKVIYEKNKSLYRILPRFFINYIRRVIHEKELNNYLLNDPTTKGFDFAEKIIDYFNVTYSVANEENIPKTGNYIVVGNHPLGGFDGLIVTNLLHKHRNDILVTSNDLLMNIPNLHELFIPINTVGTNTTDLARRIEVAFKQENVILFFPAGLCSRRIKGEIVDLVWKKTFVTKAKAYQRDIIPIYFEGRNSNFFYNLSAIRKKLGIKLNIEMMYLVDELFKHKNKHFRLVVGKPISYKSLNPNKTDFELAQEIKKNVYALKQYLY